MIFTWSSHNLCIVFRWWRVTGPLSLILSLLAVALLTAGYEGVRQISRRYEQSHDTRMSAFMDRASSTSRSAPFALLATTWTALKIGSAKPAKMQDPVNRAYRFW